MEAPLNSLAPALICCNLRPAQSSHESRLNRGQNLKITNLRHQANHDPGNVPLKNNK